MPDAVSFEAAAGLMVPGWQEDVKRLTGGLGADIIYETVGSAFSRAALDALAPCGELVLAAMGRFGLEAADVEHMLDDNQSIKGFSLLPLLTPQCVQEDLAALFELAAAGALTVIDGGRFPLHQAAERIAPSKGGGRSARWCWCLKSKKAMHDVVRYRSASCSGNQIAVAISMASWPSVASAEGPAST
nr:zinc-binding dehydrogenase [Rhizobium leguminosarum]